MSNKGFLDKKGAAMVDRKAFFSLSYGVYIVTNGTGSIVGNQYKKAIKKGDYFFMPASLMGKFNLCGNIEAIECY